MTNNRKLNYKFFEKKKKVPWRERADRAGLAATEGDVVEEMTVSNGEWSYLRRVRKLDQRV